MKRANWITANPYGVPVLVYVGTWKQYAAYLKQKYRVETVQVARAGQCSEYSNDENGGYFVGVWLRHKPDMMSKVWILTHEMLHAADCILDRVGVTDKNEALAYLQEYLCEEAFLAIMDS